MKAAHAAPERAWADACLGKQVLMPRCALVRDDVDVQAANHSLDFFEILGVADVAHQDEPSVGRDATLEAYKELQCRAVHVFKIVRKMAGDDFVALGDGFIGRRAAGGASMNVCGTSARSCTRGAR